MADAGRRVAGWARCRAWLGWWISASGFVLAAGCATPPATRPLDESGGGPLAGRLALQVAASPQSAARQDTVAFELRGSSRAGELVLTSPIGTVMAKASWAPGGAELRTAEGSRRFDSVEALAADVLGEPLPLQALTDWLRGRPWAGAPHSPSPLGFVQEGWEVETSTLAQGLLTARRSAAPAITLRARLQEGR